MKKILVANRGEIALRVMKTAKKMGIKTVAVYSVADRQSPHVKFADEAVCIGEAPSNQSYLLGDKIIEVCKKLGVDGIHPGYGFLSENSTFAELAEKNNITFIGPKSHAMRVMGDKLAAKDTVKAYDIPMVPGLDHAITDIDEAKKVAKEVGFPILIKASAGGGGKGMRVVEKEEDFESQMQRAISEATSAFGDGSVFIEKYVGSPRHIEIQVMADTHGNVVYLFERECSVQRRHQKVVEEAPSAVLTPEIRKAMGEAAVKVAKSCDYVGAGTVEFLLDENKNFYFLEMNTRLQVEHPVTELITGIDLVEMQIRVARGEVLPITQEDLHIKGHALELRVYAEDPLNDFLPSVGNLETYILPEGEGIRVDNGFEQGMDVPIYYDPMLSKLITYGKDRNEAIQLMLKAIQDYKVEGVSTTLPFGTFVFEHDAFVSGNFDTNFVKKFYSADIIKENQAKEAEIAALVALKQYFADQKVLRVPTKL
ncbi:acetyl-CoA carboxylase biotin carboxylase subunit [Flavobacterium sp. xlx-214]|uniref:acetyl-CoA carboxylase biotin carboxylase subunit n=1 Tax=unclassified Flavobacterium TaxID=196869 RepID=UPI0013D8CAC7|nr:MULTISPECIES: acetyl-CoA carboxylase biotin carboxylase subunit [unclassified Flavobacterium]MBA5792233.1 acetyl-CoA carboxylase biotin carboxylase subunit [Flavobacterium sp. xlx-221]QMI84475.1 acetyl-CoA carboxylase biotin carboxylase subunit [Flavobacterium sp. xlx-214]